MVQKAKLKLKKFKPVAKYGPKQIAVFAGVFAVIGGIAIILTHAASIPSSFEAEDGNRDGNVSLNEISSASGGRSIKFGTSGTSTAGCGLANAAFCDSFSAAHPVAGTRSGDLDPEKWGVSRVISTTNPGQNQLSLWQYANLDGQTVMAPNDIKITGGQLREAVTDGGNQTILAMYPKQPFDFAGRTGKIVFDVNADADDGHAAWPEFWITDQPVPAPGPDAPGVWTFARNSFGFAVDQQNGSYPCSNDGTETGIGSMWITRNYQLVNVNWVNAACIKKGDLTHLNHFEIRMSLNRTEVWGSDGGGANFKLMGYTTDAMPMTRGVIWINDVHYNACKFTDQCSHQFNWDNVAFDGPTPYRDLTFDVPDALETSNNGKNLGYLVSETPRTFNVTGVNWSQTPTATYVLLNYHLEAISEVPQVSVNGNPYIAMVNPFSNDTYRWRTIAIPVPFDQIKTGTNTISIKGPAGTIVANINLALIAGAPVQ